MILLKWPLADKDFLPLTYPLGTGPRAQEVIRSPWNVLILFKIRKDDRSNWLHSPGWTVLIFVPRQLWNITFNTFVLWKEAVYESQESQFVVLLVTGAQLSCCCILLGITDYCCRQATQEGTLPDSLSLRDPTSPIGFASMSQWQTSWFNGSSSWLGEGGGILICCFCVMWLLLHLTMSLSRRRDQVAAECCLGLERASFVQSLSYNSRTCCHWQKRKVVNRTDLQS